MNTPRMFLIPAVVFGGLLRVQPLCLIQSLSVFVEITFVNIGVELAGLGISRRFLGRLRMCPPTPAQRKAG